MSYIDKHWATFGGIMAVVIIVLALIIDKELSNIQTIFWIHLATLLLHQFEEYTYPGMFKDFFNTNIWNKNAITRFPLNEKGILVINIILAWTMYFFASFVGVKVVWLTFGLAGITITNGIMHTIMFVKLKKYNPGLITGFLIFIPFGLYLLTRLKNYAVFENLILGLIIFVIGTLSIPLSIYLTNKNCS
jgi:hypothetical protein